MQADPAELPLASSSSASITSSAVLQSDMYPDAVFECPKRRGLQLVAWSSNTGEIGAKGEIPHGAVMYTGIDNPAAPPLDVTRLRVDDTHLAAQGSSNAVFNFSSSSLLSTFDNILHLFSLHVRTHLGSPGETPSSRISHPPSTRRVVTERPHWAIQTVQGTYFSAASILFSPFFLATSSTRC